MSVARVQARGQVTIPQEIREDCRIDPGSDLFFVKTGSDTFECHVLPRKRPILEVAAQYAGEGLAPDFDSLYQGMADDLAREHLPESQRVTPA